MTPAAATAAAGDRQLERERAGAADDLLAVARGVHPLERQDSCRSAPACSTGRPPAEVVADRADRVAELVESGGDLTDVDASRDLLQRRVVEHQPPLAAVAGEAHRDDAAGLDPR